MTAARHAITRTVVSSAPCRVDLGGTLDLASFYLPLQAENPATFHLALEMRTTVTVSPWKTGRVRIESKGFQSAEFDGAALPFTHPMGLMFGIISFFGVDSVKVEIHSASPPRSALGGSSVASVALSAALLSAIHGVKNGDELQWRSARISQSVESAVAGVVCGIQDQLAAAFGGVSLWHWEGEGDPRREALLSPETGRDLADHLVVAYCGVPHDSLDINTRWVKGFLSGAHRREWSEMIQITHDFAHAFEKREWDRACELMNRETDIRCSLTPDVLDSVGSELVARARENGCGARFTGAGGGGCLWAIGEKEQAAATRKAWAEVLDATPQGRLLTSGVAWRGVEVGQ